ncbi:MAG: hypothetical protein ACYCS7_13165 [Acidimicrobiales bacterium]
MAPQLDAPHRLAIIDRSLLWSGATAGLLGGAALFLIMGGYYASEGMGFASMLNACFAAFVFSSATAAAAPPGQKEMTGAGAGSMTHETTTSSAMAHTGTTMAPTHAMSSTHTMTMATPIVSSHLAVGSALHVGMSVLAGAAFVIVLGLLIRAGIRQLASPTGYVLGGLAGGGLLYTVMMYAVAPSLNTTIVDFTPRVPFFIAHLAFGATVGAFVYWRRRHVAS